MDPSIKYSGRVIVHLKEPGHIFETDIDIWSFKNSSQYFFLWEDTHKT